MTTASHALLSCENWGICTTSGWESPLISLDLQQGQVAAIVGKAGSGKSLLLEQIVGVQRPGVSPRGELHCPSFQFVPQDARLAVLPTDQVGALVGLVGWRATARRWFGISPAPTAEEKRIAGWMSRLRLDPSRLAHLPYRELSATERRSILICRSLLAQPKLLIVDGWDEMMDAHGRAALADILREEMKSGLALLTTSRTYPLRGLHEARNISLGHHEESGDLALPLLGKRISLKATAQALLEVKNLSVSHRKPGLLRRPPPAFPVNGASFSIQRGETLVLLGAAGSGKTTLLETIAGLQSPSTGQIHFTGHEVTNARGSRARRLRREVQLVFQDASSALDGPRSVKSHLDEARSLSNSDSISPGRWLERLGLSPRLLKSPADQLSASESQRVDLARSLVRSPSLVLLDSPEVSGAESDGGLISSLLSAEKSRGCSFLVATSDPEIALSLADRIAVFHAGRVVELGSREEVLRNPSHPITQAILTQSALAPASPTKPLRGCPHVHECPRRKLPLCSEKEPQLTPLRTIEDLNDLIAYEEQAQPREGPHSFQRRAACFQPIIE